MKQFLTLFIFTILFTLTSCGNSSTEQTGSGSETQPPLENISSTGNEFTAFLTNPSNDSVEFAHEPGQRDYVYFINTNTGSTLDVQVVFANETPGNFRLSQIIMPDGASDGPFGTALNNYPLTQAGGYELIFAESNMVGEPFSGEVRINLSIQ